MTMAWPFKQWDWIHPSYRDLVIDQLSANAEMAEHYLRHGGVAAVALSLSVNGGLKGQRSFPLMQHFNSWLALSENIKQLVRSEGTGDYHRIAQMLMSLSKEGQYAKERKTLAIDLNKTALDWWNTQEIYLSSTALKSYYDLGRRTNHFFHSPELLTSWRGACRALKASLKWSKEDSGECDVEEILAWTSLRNLLRSSEPRFMEIWYDANFAMSMASDFLDLVENEVESQEDDYSDLDEIGSQEEKLNSLLTSAFELAAEFKPLSEALERVEKAVAKDLSKLDYLRSEFVHLDEETDQGWRPSGSYETPHAELERIFSDL